MFYRTIMMPQNRRRKKCLDRKGTIAADVATGGCAAVVFAALKHLTLERVMQLPGAFQ
jgi:hypothetical protein